MFLFMEGIKGIGRFLIGFVIVWLLLMFLASKFTEIGRGLGIAILVVSLLAGVTSAFYKDGEDGNSEE